MSNLNNPKSNRDEQQNSADAQQQNWTKNDQSQNAYPDQSKPASSPAAQNAAAKEMPNNENGINNGRENSSDSMKTQNNANNGNHDNSNTDKGNSGDNASADAKSAAENNGNNAATGESGDGSSALQMAMNAGQKAIGGLNPNVNTGSDGGAGEEVAQKLNAELSKAEKAPAAIVAAAAKAAAQDYVGAVKDVVMNLDSILWFVLILGMAGMLLFLSILLVPTSLIGISGSTRLETSITENYKETYDDLQRRIEKQLVKEEEEGYKQAVRIRDEWHEEGVLESTDEVRIEYEYVFGNNRVDSRETVLNQYDANEIMAIHGALEENDVMADPENLNLYGTVWEDGEIIPKASEIPDNGDYDITTSSGKVFSTSKTLQKQVSHYAQERFQLWGVVDNTTPVLTRSESVTTYIEVEDESEDTEDDYAPIVIPPSGPVSPDVTSEDAAKATESGQTHLEAVTTTTNYYKKTGKITIILKISKDRFMADEIAKLSPEDQEKTEKLIDEFMNSLRALQGDMAVAMSESVLAAISNFIGTNEYETYGSTHMITSAALPYDTTNASVQVSSPFGRRSGFTNEIASNHSGIDYAGPKGTDVLATADGIVIGGVTGLTLNTYPNGNPSYGNYVVLYHGRTSNGYDVFSIYGHMDSVTVPLVLGTEVTTGEVIGKIGNTGYSTGPHLHFEFDVCKVGETNGYAINPEIMYSGAVERIK